MKRRRLNRSASGTMYLELKPPPTCSFLAKNCVSKASQKARQLAAGQMLGWMSKWRRHECVRASTRESLDRRGRCLGSQVGALFGSHPEGPGSSRSMHSSGGRAEGGHACIVPTSCRVSIDLSRRTSGRSLLELSDLKQFWSLSVPQLGKAG